MLDKNAIEDAMLIEAKTKRVGNHLNHAYQKQVQNWVH